jgi:hypothetical protein
MQEYIDYRKRRFAVQPDVKDTAGNGVTLDCGERWLDPAEWPHYLRAQDSNNLIQLHGDERVIFDKK